MRALRGIGETWKSAVSGEQQCRVDITNHRIDGQVFIEIDPELGRIGLVVVIVPDRLPPRGQKFRRSHGNVSGMEMGDIDCVVEVLFGAAQSERLVEGVERARLDRGRGARRAFSFLGDDGDHAADRVGTVEPALRTAQDFHLLDVGCKKMRVVERAIRVADIADVDSVEEHFGVVGVGAAHEDRGLGAWSAGLYDVQAGDRVQDVRNGAVLLGLDILLGDDGERACQLTGRRHDSRRADHHRHRRAGRGSVAGRKLLRSSTHRAPRMRCRTAGRLRHIRASRRRGSDLDRRQQVGGGGLLREGWRIQADRSHGGEEGGGKQASAIKNDGGHEETSADGGGTSQRTRFHESPAAR